MNAIIPFAELSPKNAAALARRASEQIAALEHWKLNLRRSVSLRASICHLEFASAANSYGSTPAELARFGKALRCVMDWLQVLNCLTDERAAHVAEELSEAIGSGENNRRADDILAQFWFGALLAHSGLRPAVPPASAGRRPDFVIHVDSYELCIEVKRPESLHSAVRAIREAAGQIRDYGKPGFVALDLSKSLDTDRFLTGGYWEPESPLEEFRSEFLKATDTIADRVRGHRSNGRYRPLMGLFMFARADAWHHKRLTSPYSSVFINAPTFERACGGLVVDASVRVGQLIRSGVEHFSGAPVRAL